MIDFHNSCFCSQDQRTVNFETEITDFFIFCQEKPFGELFLKTSLKLAREVSVLRNPTKSGIAAFALQP